MKNANFHPEMHVISGQAVKEILRDIQPNLIDIVLKTYIAHEKGQTINPDSYFLRYPERPSDRIIALPAALTGDDADLSGIKWIASYPENTKTGIARASAVIVLNDNRHGYPFAFMEAAAISAARTPPIRPAASSASPSRRSLGRAPPSSSAHTSSASSPNSARRCA